jgi:hypothetical protein
MPLKLNVGLSKKIGLPDYSSLGASCHVELELDQSLIYADLEGFHDRVRQAFVACSQAVRDELYRQQPDAVGHASHSGNGTGPSISGRGASARRHPRDQTRPATASQVKAIAAIAKRQQLALTELLWNDYGINRADELTITEASRLIDALKATPEGNGHSNGHSAEEAA